MSKEETPSGGLLSKVVKFVRNPTVNWSDLDSLDADRDSQYSKQMLKEMIERKRRNDFVRRREFDQLRKLRQREAQQGQRLEDTLARASFFSTSMNGPDDRADTLKKIDEIEAQMSQQWWKGRDPGLASTQAPAFAPPPPAAGGGSEPQRTIAAPSPFAPAQSAAMSGAQGRIAEQAPAFAPTAQLGLPAMADMTLRASPRDDAGALLAEPLLAQAEEAQPRVLEQEPFVHDPDLEEAAIRFASGDYDGAEAGLREVLAQQQPGAAQQHETWMTLFDFYRAIGRQDPFDVLAIDYAAHFGRSAPQWFSLPERLGLQAQSNPAAAVAVQREFSWGAPPALTQQSLTALQAALGRSMPPWRLNWTRLAEIEPQAVALLAQQFEDWAERDVQIRFAGVQVLQSLLQSRTVSGERAADPQWWRLRLAALRLMGLHDEFEFVALDYCVTYEVSPPSWMSPRCGYSGDDGAQTALMLDGVDSDLPMSGFTPSQPARAEEGPVAALQGTIDGDARPALQPLEALARPGVPLVVSCDRLVRMDFAAVGSALNWAAEQQAQGRAVHFSQLHRLVAVLFNMIGLNEHARVTPRRD
ncbi:STAS domain-containing protein [Alicycliphilus denitrificans]|uniref:STAS domain-containing protein n=1 Tax=Alicycliphilus denitrificans TaxID=179636 RepID=UPI00384F57AC